MSSENTVTFDLEATGIRSCRVVTFKQAFHEWRPGVGFPKNTTLKQSFFFQKFKQRRFGI